MAWLIWSRSKDSVTLPTWYCFLSMSQLYMSPPKSVATFCAHLWNKHTSSMVMFNRMPSAAGIPPSCSCNFATSLLVTEAIASGRAVVSSTGKPKVTGCTLWLARPFSSRARSRRSKLMPKLLGSTHSFNTGTKSFTLTPSNLHQSSCLTSSSLPPALAFAAAAAAAATDRTEAGCPGEGEEAASASTPQSWKQFQDHSGNKYWHREPDGKWFYERDTRWQRFLDDGTQKHWWYNLEGGLWFFEP
mmetsp:Transcript_35520/g.115015  ORF Transcript_35520/g.115015 Transcript_35520/m.115015 type:complete len:245 (-) Transcript_35520:132-866(-)